MSRRTLGIAVFGVGAALVLVAALADVVGIGNPSEFGLRQTAGVVVGLAAVVFGGLALWKGS